MFVNGTVVSSAPPICLRLLDTEWQLFARREMYYQSLAEYIGDWANWSGQWESRWASSWRYDRTAVTSPANTNA